MAVAQKPRTAEPMETNIKTFTVGMGVWPMAYHTSAGDYKDMSLLMIQASLLQS